jgi:hypothetical protein
VQGALKNREQQFVIDVTDSFKWELLLGTLQRLPSIL